MANSNITNIAYENPSSGISYTNKDFNSVYNEELDTVKELTKRWDPTISNESDPGVVLLKENAIMVDKENYNIDKNVLETFPLSVSQYGNARQLYDSLGYEMKWYRSAVTENIAYKYVGSKDLSDGSANRLTIEVPRFTMVADSTGEYVYTIIEPKTMIKKNESYAVTAMQGVITEFKIGGSENITLANLDADLRLYIPETMVAENGIFIRNVGDGDNWGEWERVQNIEGYTSQNKKIYSFGVLPNSNTCYIQFPQDIADVIGNGLNINYLITLGEAGNIPANTIESFYSDNLKDSNGDSVNADDLIVTNILSVDNGENTEDLRSAYRNYKKTVGTFNTLVTCRDYENNIYSRVDAESSEPIVSNVVVSDRTNDIVNSHNVVVLTQEGTEKELAVTVKDGAPSMTAFDLGLYLLEPMGSTYNAKNYAKSFSVNKTYSYVEQEISDVKSMQHDYINTQYEGTDEKVGRTFMIKNFYDLTGKVITYYKVTEEDAKDIEDKIKTALYAKFNAREMDFGVPADYDYLVETIKNADSRIKSVILNEPVYEAYVMKGKDTEGTSTSSNVYKLTDFSGDGLDMSKEVLANLIANGNVQLYKFDSDFQYSFGETLTNQFKNISTITTTATITVPTDSSNPYEIKENESVILISPSLVSKVTYTYHTQYKFNGSNTVVAGEPYTLGAGESLSLKWTSDGTEYTYTYGAGKIIKSSKDIINSDTYNILGQTDTIEYMDINSVTLSGNTAGDNLLCYWILNNKDNVLFDSEHKEKILDQNEFFLYTDKQMTDLVVLGSGTKLSTVDNISEKVKISVEKVDITAENLTEEAKKLEWYNKFSNLTIEEQDILVLESGTRVYADSVITNINNTYSSLVDGNILYYKDKDSSAGDDPKQIQNSTTIKYKLRSRLDINSPIGNPQALLSNQSFTIKKSSEAEGAPGTTINGNDTTPIKVEFNYGLSQVGGENLDFSALDSAGNVTYPISAMTYTGSGAEGVDQYITVSPDSDVKSFTFTNNYAAIGEDVTYDNVIIPFITTGEPTQIEGVYYSINGDLYNNGCLYGLSASSDIQKNTQYTFGSGEWLRIYGDAKVFGEGSLYTFDDTSSYDPSYGYAIVTSITIENETYSNVVLWADFSISNDGASHRVASGKQIRVFQLKKEYTIGSSIYSNMLLQNNINSSSPYVTIGTPILKNPLVIDQNEIDSIIPRAGSNYISSSVSYWDSFSVAVVFNDGASGVAVLLGKINPYNGYYVEDVLAEYGINSKSDPTLSNYMGDVVDKIEDFATYNTDAYYDISYRVPEDDMLEDPFAADSFWDVDNPYNRFTIAQMRDCNVSVIKSSKI